MKILCATDLLPKSEAAIERAALLTDGLGADLTLMHVVAPVESDRVLEQTLQMALGHMKSRTRPPLWRAGRKPNVAVRTGSPARLILDTIVQSKVGLTILGPHRKRPLRDALEGTIAEKILASRKCPVLVVQREPAGPYRRVLLALDTSDASASAIRVAESLVLTPEADARVVHAHEPPYEGMLHYAGIGADSIAGYAAGWSREAATAIRDLLKHESADFARYHVRVEQSPPASAILRAANLHQADLLVLGTRGGGRLHRALLGSVANRVLHDAACDVLIVPEGSIGTAKRKSLLGTHRSRAVSGEQPGAMQQRAPDPVETAVSVMSNQLVRPA
jgi:nucleotide-binding universal stress UspA family protein